MDCYTSFDGIGIAYDVRGNGPAAPRAFRAFADSTGADRQALAAIQRAPRNGPAVTVEAIKVPLLVITGDRDVLVGSPHDLAAEAPNARVVVVQGDHLSAVNDPE